MKTPDDDINAALGLTRRGTADDAMHGDRLAEQAGDYPVPAPHWSPSLCDDPDAAARAHAALVASRLPERSEFAREHRTLDAAAATMPGSHRRRNTQGVTDGHGIGGSVRDISPVRSLGRHEGYMEGYMDGYRAARRAWSLRSFLLGLFVAVLAVIAAGQLGVLTWTQ